MYVIGTGIAPFRAMCWQRYAELEMIKQHQEQDSNINIDDSVHQQSQSQPDYGRIDVYFGCRHRNVDFYYASEWQYLLRSNTINTFNVSFSRDHITQQYFDMYNELPDYNTTLPHDSNTKIYVQHKLLQNSIHIYNTLFNNNNNNNSVLMIAGSSGHMPRDIYNTIVNIIIRHSNNNIDEQQAKLMIKQLQQQKRYLVETWG